MFLTKFLKRKSKSSISGQASLEYFLLLAAIGALGLISLSSFLPKVRKALYGQGGTQYVSKAIGAIITADRY